MSLSMGATEDGRGLVEAVKLLKGLVAVVSKVKERRHACKDQEDRDCPSRSDFQEGAKVSIRW